MLRLVTSPGLVALLLMICAATEAVLIDIEDGEAIFIEQRETVIRVDGKLDEPVWQALDAWDEFVVIEPDSLGETAHATLIRIFHTQKGLYVGAEMQQPVRTLIRRLSGRDQRSVSRDSISLTLDTSGEGRYGYWFGINLGDSLMDGTVLPERRFSNEWDGAWRGASQQTETGWTAEFFIPWSIMAMQKLSGEQRRFGLYMSRKVAYLDERWGWPALPGTLPRFMSVLQTINLKGVDPGMEYSFYPFIAAGQNFLDKEATNRIGADIFWRPSSNFQLSATVNPDFGIVESDNVVVNLSATEVFFPEKRLFFLEGQDLFVTSPRARNQSRGVGNTGSPTTLLNTRRIGGSARQPELPGVTINQVDEVRPAELLFAAKATGQLGKLRYGLLGALEDELEFRARRGEDDIRIVRDGSRYGAFRLSWEDSQQGDYRSIGLLGTATEHFDGDANVIGLDTHYLTPDGKFRYDGQWFLSSLEGEENGTGGFIDLEYTFRRGLQQRFGLTYYDENVDINDLGFLQRNDVLQIRSAHIRTTSNISWARENQFDIRGFVQKNRAGLFTGSGIFLSDRMNFHNLSRLTLRLSFFPKSFDDLNSFGNGAYRIDNRIDASIRYDSNSTKKLSFDLSIGGGGERVGGRFLWIRSGLTWQPNDHFTLDVSARYMDRNGWLLHQEDRNMTSFQAEQWQPELSVEYFFTARHQLKASLQWVGIRAREQDFFLIDPQPDDLIRVEKPAGPSDSFAVSDLALQLRYRWEIAPLSDLFIVYTRQADRDLALGELGFSDLADDALNQPFVDLLVFKLRYRFGS